MPGGYPDFVRPDGSDRGIGNPDNFRTRSRGGTYPYDRPTGILGTAGYTQGGDKGASTPTGDPPTPKYHAPEEPEGHDSVWDRFEEAAGTPMYFQGAYVSDLGSNVPGMGGFSGTPAKPWDDEDVRKNPMRLLAFARNELSDVDNNDRKNRNADPAEPPPDPELESMTTDLVTGAEPMTLFPNVVVRDINDKQPPPLELVIRVPSVWERMIQGGFEMREAMEKNFDRRKEHGDELPYFEDRGPYWHDEQHMMPEDKFGEKEVQPRDYSYSEAFDFMAPQGVNNPLAKQGVANFGGFGTSPLVPESKVWERLNTICERQSRSAPGDVWEALSSGRLA